MSVAASSVGREDDPTRSAPIGRFRLLAWSIRGSLQRLREFVATLTVAAVTSVTPSALDQVACSVLHRGLVRFRPARVRRIAERIEQVVGDPSRTEPSEWSVRAAIAYWRTRIEVRWGEARGAGLRGWSPEVAIDGIEHLDAAIASGTGAVLWRMSFCSATVVNAALHEHGHDVVHLSSEAHRRSADTWFARRITAPFYTRSEARWLDRRVIRPDSGGLAYMLELKAALLENRVVTIVGDQLTSRHAENHPIGNIELSIPTGAPSLAYATGASLHTCVALRTGTFRYRLLIGPDLGISSIPTKSAARRHATAEFARQLDHHLRTSPESAMWGRR